MFNINPVSGSAVQMLLRTTAYGLLFRIKYNIRNKFNSMHLLYCHKKRASMKCLAEFSCLANSFIDIRLKEREKKYPLRSFMLQFAIHNTEEGRKNQLDIFMRQQEVHCYKYKAFSSMSSLFLYLGLLSFQLALTFQLNDRANFRTE